MRRRDVGLPDFRSTRGGRYCRARYYHPGLQRFIAEDPIGFAAGDANLYAYVGNDPVNSIDPDGLKVLNPRNYPVTPAVLAALTKFNTCIGSKKDVVITGGDRPPSSRLGAGRGSTHVQGLAADIVVPGQAHSITTYQAIASGLFGGVGWYEEGYRGPLAVKGLFRWLTKQRALPMNPAAELERSNCRA